MVITAERTFLKLLQGGCSEPSAAFAQINGDKLDIHAFIGTTSGKEFFEATASGMAHDHTRVATQVYETLLDMGAIHLIRGDSVE